MRRTNAGAGGVHLNGSPSADRAAEVLDITTAACSRWSLHSLTDPSLGAPALSPAPTSAFSDRMGHHLLTEEADLPRAPPVLLSFVDSKTIIVKYIYRALTIRHAKFYVNYLVELFVINVLLVLMH